jgi:hypothetical protein
MTGSEKIRRMQIALEYGGNAFSVSDIIELLHAGKAKLVENDDGCMILELHKFPQFTAVHLWLLFGTIPAVLALEDEAIAWGLENGASVATAVGRPGWGKVSAPRGWVVTPNMVHHHKVLPR